ncbi:MAG: hypothetical protein Kow0092_38440 [Deferrisomatales bacterium]
MDVLKAMEEKAFWGHEFLTWLWYRTETEGGELEVPGVGPVTLWVDDRLVLASLDTESKENILREGAVSQCAEAVAALTVGKKVQEARFGLVRDDREWSFVLKGDTFDLATVKLPKVEAEEGDDWQATALIRAGLIRECLEVLDGLFRDFVELRISARWVDETLPAMGRWIAEKQGG